MTDGRNETAPVTEAEIDAADREWCQAKARELWADVCRKAIARYPHWADALRQTRVADFDPEDSQLVIEVTHPGAFGLFSGQYRAMSGNAAMLTYLDELAGEAFQLDLLLLFEPAMTAVSQQLVEMLHDSVLTSMLADVSSERMN